MTFDRNTLVIPDNTKFEEHTIITNGDVVIGDRCSLDFGIKTNGRIFIGEHTSIGGKLEASDDIRVDNFSKIDGDVKSKGNVYLGEKCTIKGKLSLEGDLDVGDSVEIEGGFEANGWINIRNPIPITIYIFLYLMQLLKMGHSEEIERILKEIEENEGEPIPISETFFFVPNNSTIGIQQSKVNSNIRVGKNSHLLGNYEAKGNIFIDNKSEIYGSLNSTENIFCGQKVIIHGNLQSKGNVKIKKETKIDGKISAKKIFLSKEASVEGTLFSEEGTSFVKNLNIDKEKIQRLNNDAKVVDEVENMME